MIVCPDTAEDSAILRRAYERSRAGALICLCMQWSDRNDAAVIAQSMTRMRAFALDEPRHFTARCHWLLAFRGY